MVWKHFQPKLPELWYGSLVQEPGTGGGGEGEGGGGNAGEGYGGGGGDIGGGGGAAGGFPPVHEAMSLTM
jgi:hypothetical protein